MKNYVVTAILHADHRIGDSDHELALRDIIEREFSDDLDSVSVNVSEVKIFRVVNK